MATKFYVDENGNQLGGFDSNEKPPKDAIEVPRPDHGNDTWDGSKWVDYDGKHKDNRKSDFKTELPEGEQFDAIHKGMASMVTLLIELGVSTARLEQLDLIPDPTKPLGTPAGALAKIQEIKNRHKKPEAK